MGITLQLVLEKRSVVKYDSLCLSYNLCVSDKMLTFQCTLQMLGEKKKKRLHCLKNWFLK